MPDSSIIESIAAELREGARLKQWAADNMAEDIAKAAEMLIAAYRAGGKALFCGNGGSAADSQHLAAELVGRYRRNRAALPAIALTTDTSVLTAVANDFGYDQVFARQVEALGRAGDVLVALSTSGDSPNCLLAIEAAKRMGLGTIGLLGRQGGKMRDMVDIALVVPAEPSSRIQECHIAIGHILCGLIEDALC